MSTATITLYDQIGGRTAIQTVVEEFYNRVLGDPKLKDFFSNTDMDKQRQHQVNFLSMALGGPNQYTGRTMQSAHSDLGITNNDFDAVAGHLVAALEWAGVEKEAISAVVDAVVPLKAHIVTV